MAKSKKGSKKSKQSQQPQASTTMATPPSVQVHEGLTHTNTDKTCLDTSKPSPFRWFYQYNLWTGLYMLNPPERAYINIFGFIMSVCMVLYLYIFFSGFRDGFTVEMA